MNWAKRSLLAVLVAVSLSTPSPALRPDVQEEVLLAGTDHELHVYRMTGREPGPTVLVLGGIHGDEPGGYRTVDLLLDRVSLFRGQLILVPRVDFASILRGDRAAGGDMNRMFVEKGPRDPVVLHLEALIDGADALLNLHDGWGFYRERWVDESHNPKRFGQSIVLDTAHHVTPGGKALDLSGMAKDIVERANRFIPDAEHRFRVLNTRTLDADSPFPELRTSATYYALTRRGIPAFGVETSKSIPSEEARVRYQFLVVRAFLQVIGLEEDPGWFPSKERDRVDFFLVRGADGMLRAVRPGDDLLVEPGERVQVEGVEGNVERGLAVDVEGVGGLQDQGRPFSVDAPTEVSVRRDAQVLARMEILPQRRGTPARTAVARQGTAQIPTSGATRAPVEGFRVDWNGVARYVPEGGVLEVPAGDEIRLLDPVGSVPPASLTLDIVGFAGGTASSSREDRGYSVDTGYALLQRFSLEGRGEYYRVRAREGSEERGGFYLRVLPPRLYDVEVERSTPGGPAPTVEWVPAEATLKVPRGETVRLLAVRTSLRRGEGLTVNFRGFPGNPAGEDRGLPVRVDQDLLRNWSIDMAGRVYEVVVSYRDTPFGRVLVEVEDGAEGEGERAN